MTEQAQKLINNIIEFIGADAKYKSYCQLQTYVEWYDGAMNANLSELEAEIKRLKEGICCFIREELGDRDINSDEEAIAWVLSFRDSQEKDDV